MSNEQTKEEVRQVATWRTKPSEYRTSMYDSGGSLNTPDTIDYAALVHDLATRIATLQSASRRVLVSWESDVLKLSTVVLVVVPPPPAPAKPAEAAPTATPSPVAKRRRPTRRRGKGSR
jgi:hypothetical protein